MPEGKRVWILDTSALIDFKALISVADQWNTFKRLEELVRSGEIAMPRQVINEASELTHPDLPGAWAPGMRSQVQFPLAVDFSYVQQVMAVAGDVVDPNKTSEEADPYVVALALHLQDQGHDPRIVTSDIVDRLPIRIALATACRRVGIVWVSPEDFLNVIGVRTRKP